MRDPSGQIAVVIVNWNNADDTIDVVEQLQRIDGPTWRFIVVDNGSEKETVAKLRAAEHLGLELIEQDENRGFAQGNCVGIVHAARDPRLEWVLLINSDVRVDPDFLPPLLTACAEPDVAAAAPKIYYEDPPDVIWAAGGRLRVRETVTLEFGRDQRDDGRWSRSRDVTYLTTCCLLIARDALERVGLLDPVYFVGVEDADWCHRAVDAGFRLRYVAESRLWHRVASSTGGTYTAVRTFHTGRSNALFARRHLGPLAMLGFLAANALALPVALLREALRGNARAVISKARGLGGGLTVRLPGPPPPMPPRPQLGG
jgi:GT2 family glycosyltransferase